MFWMVKSTNTSDVTVWVRKHAPVVSFSLICSLFLCFFVQGKFFWQVKIGYTIGHSVSLVSLTTAIVILCIFRYVDAQ